MSDIPVATKDVQLPCGLGPDKEGRIHRDATIAPMTGAVRKNIARPEVRQNLGKIVDTILLSGLKRVGPVERIDRRVLDKMLIGDRDFLMLEIRKLSMTSAVNATMKCGSCGDQIDIKYDLNRIPIRQLADKGDGIEVSGLERLFTLDWTSEDGKITVNGKFRFPNGNDQLLTAQGATRNPIEANYNLWYRCLQEWDGKPVEKVSPTLFDDLTLPVVDAVDAEFRKRQPGPDLRQPVSCPLCGADNDLDLSASDFLFPLVRGRTSTA